MIRQDYIKRAIEQLGAAIAAAARLSQKDPEQALAALQQAKAELPLVPGVLERTAPELLPSLLPSAELREQAAELYELESRLHKERGDTKAALAAMRSCAALRELTGELIREPK